MPVFEGMAFVAVGLRAWRRACGLSSPGGHRCGIGSLPDLSDYGAVLAHVTPRGQRCIAQSGSSIVEISDFDRLWGLKPYPCGWKRHVMLAGGLPEHVPVRIMT